MPGFTERVQTSERHGAIILIRLLVGAVFLSEGIQKFLFPDSLGRGSICQNWDTNAERQRTFRRRH